MELILSAREHPGNHGDGTVTLRWLLADRVVEPTPRVVKLSELRRT